MSGSAVIIAGAVAAVISTLVQLLLWAMLTDALPAIFFRDARLAASIVLGTTVLRPDANSGVQIMLVATLVHFALSIVYALVLAAIVAQRGIAQSMLIGTLFGLALYAINLHVF